MKEKNEWDMGRTTNCTYCQSPTDPRSRIIPIRVFGLTRDSRTNLTLVQSVVRLGIYIQWLGYVGVLTDIDWNSICIFNRNHQFEKIMEHLSSWPYRTTILTFDFPADDIMETEIDGTKIKRSRFNKGIAIMCDMTIFHAKSKG